jgi:hypothetical protein
MPSEQLLTAMGKYNEELVKAGIMLAGDGLHPSSRAKRVLFAGGPCAMACCSRLQPPRRKVVARAAPV